jgi:methionyl-tRNA formyltransferase
MNIIFFGTSEFAGIILEKMIQVGLKPALVVTTPDKPAGRRQRFTPPPVKILADKYNLRVVQPESISNFQFLISNQILNPNDQNTRPDLFVLAAYGKIVPKKILGVPKYGTLNVHPSLLPKHRGPSPVQTAILEGDTETGVTIMLMDEEIDHGPIIASTKYNLQDTRYAYEELHNKLADIGADLLIDTIPKWINEEIKAKEQNHGEATFTKKFSREDGRIDWNKDAEYIDRQVRAFSPWPGAFTMWKEKRIKILKAHVEQKKLVIDELQVEGKNPTTFREFLLGNKDFKMPSE